MPDTQVTVTFDPEKWQVVPKEITEDMANAMECAFSTEGQWEAALKMAPSPDPLDLVK